MGTQFNRLHWTRTSLRVLPIILLFPLLTHCQALTTNTDLLEAQNNTRPVARAGIDSVSPVGAELSLDGTGSYDPDGDEISYYWTVEEKPAASQLSDSPFSVNGDRNAGHTTVIPDVEGTFVFALQVEDPSRVRSNTDRVIYQVKSSLDLPIADAGNSLSGLEGTPLCLNGSESFDPNGLALEYLWSLVSVPEGSVLVDADLQINGEECCITVDVPGTVAVALVVNNGLEDSEPDFAFVAAASTNEGPQAVVEVVSAASCDFIRLTGENSTDPEADSLSYSWEVLVVPLSSTVATGTSAFDDANSGTPAFYADVPGEYTVQLVVDDGESFSIPVFADVQVQMTTQNSPPLVIPSPDAYVSNSGPSCPTGSSQQFCPEVVVPLNALDTLDPDGDLVSFNWEVVVADVAAGSPACYSLEMRDSFGDGWNGASVQVREDGTSIGNFSVSLAQSSAATGNFCVADGALVELYFTGGTWDSEVSYDLIDAGGNVLFSQSQIPGGPPNGLAFSFTAGASAFSRASLASTTGAENELTINGPSACPDEINTYEIEVVVTGTDCVGASSQATVAVVYHCGP